MLSPKLRKFFGKNKKYLSYLKGVFSEYYAIIFLLFKGYKILKLRYRSPFGEIDIIAFKKDYFIFIEVKSRKKLREMTDVLSQKQQERIISSSQYFLQHHQPYRPSPNIRYDLIFIYDRVKIQHIKSITM